MSLMCPLLAAFEKLEERAGQGGLLGGAQREVERPEVLVVGGEHADAEEVDAGFGTDSVLCAQAALRHVGRHGAVEQRDEPPVARVEYVVEGDVAVDSDLHAADSGQVDVAALRCEGGVELRAVGRPLHEVQGGILGGKSGCEEQRRQQKGCFFHCGSRFRGRTSVRRA